MGVIVPQYSDASGIYDASNQIEWRAAVSFAFYLPKEPAASIRLLAVINFFAFSKPPVPAPYNEPIPNRWHKKLCETFSFLHIFVAYHQRLLQLNAGAKKTY